jgi:Lysophospholipase L1 and related esterases
MANSTYSWTVVFSIGMNDSGISEGENKVPEAEYRRNIQQIVDRTKELADQVIAIGLNPIDESELANRDEGNDYLNSEVKKYEQILSEVCLNNGVTFIPTFDRLADEEDWNQNLFDGIHPNSEGHRKIYEIVSEPVKTELDFQHSI